jgi:predicted nucleotidyltransferase component of viral defense system
MSANVPASVKARLLNQARQAGEELELYLVRYACERFLYRLGASPLRDRYVLKGAALLALWVDDPYRATRDLDFLAFGASDPESLREVVETLCEIECPEDGLGFDLSSLEITPLREEDKYPGQRAVFRALLGKARIRLQVDFGFGDQVVPPAEVRDYPTMLAGLPAPRLRTYPTVVTLAEKFDAMVQLGRRNSRMKDFHDVWALSSELPFEGPTLREAIVACFERRDTAWTAEVPDALGSAFYGDADLQARWSAYLRAGAFRDPPPAEFETIGERVRGFLGPVRANIVAGESFDMHWPARGPWKGPKVRGGEDV